MPASLTFLFIYLFIYLFQYNMREQALNKYKADLEEASDKLQQSKTYVYKRILVWELKVSYAVTRFSQVI